MGFTLNTGLRTDWDVDPGNRAPQAVSPEPSTVSLPSSNTQTPPNTTSNITERTEGDRAHGKVKESIRAMVRSWAVLSRAVPDKTMRSLIIRQPHPPPTGKQEPSRVYLRYVTGRHKYRRHRTIWWHHGDMGWTWGVTRSHCLTNEAFIDLRHLFSKGGGSLQCPHSQQLHLALHIYGTTSRQVSLEARLELSVKKALKERNFHHQDYEFEP